MIAPAATGSPHDTLNATAVTTTMYAACMSATASRPSASQVTIVPTDVGVETIRRETPSCFVSTSAPAAVIDVRNMNRTSWVDAPNVNCENPANTPTWPTCETTTVTPGIWSTTPAAARSAVAQSGAAPSA